jgi:PAS domain S-box-containing protein
VAKERIMIVEDEGIIVSHIKMCMKNLGYTVSCVTATGEDAIQEAEWHRPDLVLMDIVLKGEMDGIDAANQIYSRYDIPIIYLTAYSSKSMLERAKKAAPFGYIIKPFEERDLHSNIEMALYKHNMEKKLKARESWLSTTLKSIGDAVIATDTNGYVTFMNPVAEASCGWMQEEAVGKPLNEVFNVIDEQTGVMIESSVSKVLKEGVIVRFADNAALTSRKGKKIYIGDSIAPIGSDKKNIIGVVISFHDVTNRKKAGKDFKRLHKSVIQANTKLKHTINELELTQQQLIRTERMSTFGQLAAGFAHQVNNPVSYIYNNFDLLAKYSERMEKFLKKCEEGKHIFEKREPAQMMAFFEEIQDLRKEIKLDVILENFVEIIKESTSGIERIKSIVSDMNLSSCIGGDLPIPANLNNVLDGILALVFGEIKHKVEIIKEYGDIPEIKCHPPQIGQVFMNLLSNAAHAIEGKGKINIKTYKNGNDVCVEIKDTGKGMPEEIQGKIFEPFFTTKEQEKNAGLGLTVAYNIIHKYSGKIDVSSRIGEGSTFTIVLPTEG